MLQITVESKENPPNRQIVLPVWGFFDTLRQALASLPKMYYLAAKTAKTAENLPDGAAIGRAAIGTVKRKHLADLLYQNLSREDRTNSMQSRLENQAVNTGKYLHIEQRRTQKKFAERQKYLRIFHIFMLH